MCLASVTSGTILYAFLGLMGAVRSVRPRAIGQCRALTSVTVHIDHLRAAGWGGPPPSVLGART